MEAGLDTQSKTLWSFLQPLENNISADADTAESAAFRSRLFFHLSNDGLDFTRRPSHPAIIQDSMERERWAISVMQQIQDLVRVMLFVLWLILTCLRKPHLNACRGFLHFE
jgi:hypothetical protein